MSENIYEDGGDEIHAAVRHIKGNIFREKLSSV